MTAIQVNDDRNRDRRLSCRDRNNKYGEEDAVQFFRIEIFVKNDKVDVHAVQDELDGHQHCDQVATREQAIHANKEKRCANKQDIAYWYVVHFCSGFDFMAITIHPIIAANNKMLTTSKGRA